MGAIKGFGTHNWRTKSGGDADRPTGLGETVPTTPEEVQSLPCPGASTIIALPDILPPMKNATNRSSIAKKAAATRKHRAAGKRAAAKRKHRAAGVKAAVTKKANIAAKKRSDTAKRAN